MSTHISVGHRPYTVLAEAVRTRFSPYGTLASVHRMADRETDQWHGFGFVAMASEAPEVSPTLDHTELNGRPAEGASRDSAGHTFLPVPQQVAPCLPLR
jgi:RNA recognition motif. (a.k.a. RRM, RBD, or RNP domain)